MCTPDQKQWVLTIAALEAPDPNPLRRRLQDGSPDWEHYVNVFTVLPQHHARSFTETYGACMTDEARGAFYAILHDEE